MNIEVSRVEVNEITPLRELHRQAMRCQIMHDSFPRRGFSDAYLIQVEGRVAGYGLVANGRVVYQSRQTNGYLAFRRSGNRGTEYYLILGDPNAPRFRSSFLLKVVTPFDLAL
jgi:hypothetical protein